jgi:hypothetical protein
VRVSGDRFFETMGIQLLRGRTISEEDMMRARKVTVINRAFVAKYFGGESPFGRQIKILPDMNLGEAYGLRAPFEIIGVVADTRHSNDAETAVQPQMWFPYTMEGDLFVQFLIVRTAGEPARLANAVRRTLTDIDKELSIFDGGPRPVREWIGRNWYTEPRFALTMFVAFASLGLVLVSIGVFGVLSYHTSRRTHEIE